MAEAESLYDFVRHVFWNALAVTKWDAASLPVLVMAALVWPISIAKRAPFAFFSLTGVFLAVYLIAGLLQLHSSDSAARSGPVLRSARAVPRGGRLQAWCSSIDSSSRANREHAIGVGLALVVALTSLPAIVANPGDVTFSALGKNAAIAIKAVRSGKPGIEHLRLAQALSRRAAVSTARRLRRHRSHR